MAEDARRCDRHDWPACVSLAASIHEEEPDAARALFGDACEHGGVVDACARIALAPSSYYDEARWFDAARFACGAGRTDVCERFFSIDLPPETDEHVVDRARACDLSDAEVCAHLARTFSLGQVAGLDGPVETERAWRRGCDLGHADSCLELGALLASDSMGNRVDAARDVWREYCSADAPRVCAALAQSLFETAASVEDLAEPYRALQAACGEGRRCLRLEYSLAYALRESSFEDWAAAERCETEAPETCPEVVEAHRDVPVRARFYATTRACLQRANANDPAVDDLCSELRTEDWPQDELLPSERWVRVEPVTYTMMRVGPSGPGDYSRERPPREATLARPFVIGATEVPEAMVRMLDGDPSYDIFGAPWPYETMASDRCPAELRRVDPLIVANALSRSRGLDECYQITDFNRTEMGQWARVESAGPDCRGYRVPSEAEWEYAARSGAREHVSFGPEDVDLMAVTAHLRNEEHPGDDSCPRGGDQLLEGPRSRDPDGREGPLPVGSLEANDWGLYDVLGNLPEWMFGIGALSYRGHAQDIEGWLVARGGSWREDAATISLGRVVTQGDQMHASAGVRLVRTVR